VHVLGLRRHSDLLVHDEIDERRYDELVSRRADRVPLQHLTGRAPFRRLDLEVGPGVFVPRPETESVVQWAIDALGGVESPLLVDLCTGSGAIALSLADEVPGATVHAVELDPTALEWAQRNDPDGRVSWHLGRVEGCLPELDGSVDLVASNPPYVAHDEAHLPEPEVVDHDPHVALFAGEDGLAVVREVERAARRLLKPGGLVVVEHSDRQGETAPQVFEAAGGWSEVADHQDLTGRPRYVTARWCTP
jgi:release factor glutamine methyltransferase